MCRILNSGSGFAVANPYEVGMMGEKN